MKNHLTRGEAFLFDHIQVQSRETKIDRQERFVGIAVILCLLATLVYFLIPPHHKAHAATLYEDSDKQQEQTYCLDWNKGRSQVLNEDNMTIANYCKKYL